MSRFKSALNNVLLYLGLIGYTALGAKIFQLLELPTEKERLETNQALLLTERVIFLERITNNTDLGEEQYQQVLTIFTQSHHNRILLSVGVRSPGILRGGLLRSDRSRSRYCQQGLQLQLGLHSVCILFSNYSDHHR